MSEWYDRAGNLATIEELSPLLADREYKRIAFTKAGNAEVSTVWLGLDHQYGDGPPLIFETMIFGGSHDNDCWRYSTEENAERGHRAIVTALNTGQDVDAAVQEWAGG